MKIGIHTINDDTNFGNRLQNFALQKVLNDYVGNTLTLQDYQGTYFPREKKYYSKKADFLNTSIGLRIRALKLSLQNHDLEYSNVRKSLIRERKFRKFTKKYVPKFPDDFYDADKLDLVIIGSDQIWNPIIRHNVSQDFLPQLVNVPKIAYAASIGIEVDDVNMDLWENVSTLKKISVREFSAKNFFSQLGLDNISVLPDPTFLLTPREWNELGNASTVKPDFNYVLTYFLGDYTKNEQYYIKKYATSKNLKIIDLNNEDNKYYTRVGPIEFIYLFAHATTIFADSYHAAVFSIIFGKNFELFNRQDNSIKKSMNTRMDTLFQIFKIESRLHLSEDYQELPPLNIELIEEVREKWATDGKNWIKTQLV